ncbi:hypothetical protein KOW79_004205 [Hemibagrus wyckioides]|uniref:Uncharacterized protein n=1 Tax=Hemibagrus wyckioides TaxID=337641 RepID=A0A9D3P1H2_9TELE|nr:hypothetical protein KOW79_004205 [Hemibagrus wyckioides]
MYLLFEQLSNERQLTGKRKRVPSRTLYQQCCDCESPKICIRTQHVASWGCGNNTAAKEREWQYQDIPSHSLHPLPEEFSSSIQGEGEEFQLVFADCFHTRRISNGYSRVKKERAWTRLK